MMMTIQRLLIMHEIHIQCRDDSAIFKFTRYICLRASCLKLGINEFGCYEAKIEESEKGQQCI